VLKKLN